MAAKGRPLPRDIKQVRIPGTLLSGLDRFLSSLHDRIIQEAATHAFARKSGASAGRVGVHDVLQAARNVLPSSVAELAEGLRSNETRHARKRAS
jgi:hypothetical protein